MGCSKRRKWRKLDISHVERKFEENVITSHIHELEKREGLFSIDTKGASKYNHLSRQARRLHLGIDIYGKKSKGDFSSSKKTIFEAISNSHKQKLLQVIKNIKNSKKTKDKERNLGQLDIWSESTVKKKLLKPQYFVGGVSNMTKHNCSSWENLKNIVPCVIAPKNDLSYNPLVEHTEVAPLSVASKIMKPTIDPIETVTDNSVGILAKDKIKDSTGVQKQRISMNARYKGGADGVKALTGVTKPASVHNFHKKKVMEKKTKAMRNREARHLMQLRKVRSKKMKALFGKSIDCIPSLLKNIKNREIQQKYRLGIREKRLRLKMDAAKKGKILLKIGRNRLIEEPVTIVPMKEDVAGNLRATPVQGAAAIAIDHLLSIRRRAKLELPPVATPSYFVRLKKRIRRGTKAWKLVKK